MAAAQRVRDRGARLRDAGRDAAGRDAPARARAAGRTIDGRAARRGARPESHAPSIVGGGPAGLAAALALVRSRKRVVLFDTWPPRNASATEVRGFVTQDGTPPAEMRRLAHEQLAEYSTFELRDEVRVENVTRRGS